MSDILILIPDCDTEGSGCQLLKESLIVTLNGVTSPAVAVFKEKIRFQANDTFFFSVEFYDLLMQKIYTNQE
jgi:hypothetical protein